MTVAACGFQLRGSYGIDEALMPMRVVGGGDLGGELRATLRRSGVELVDDAAAAASTLRILERDRERRIVAITETGRVDAYEIVQSVEWQLDGRAATDEGARPELIAANVVAAWRSYDFDPDAVLSRDDQEEIIDELLLRDVVDRILFRIQAWSPDG